jgi:RNA polymerase sigma-70 factor (ECF subfamily)
VTDARVELAEALSETSSSLVARIRDKEPEAWTRLVQLYSPLVYRWCQRYGLQEADMADVGQDVFRTVAQSIADFHHDQTGDSFRGWLHAITCSRVLDFLRRRAREVVGAGGSDVRDQMLQVPGSDADSDEKDREDDKLVLLRSALELVLASCKEDTRQAFLKVVIEGRRPAEVAQELGMTANTIYLAKSRILRRIREEFAQLVHV